MLRQARVCKYPRYVITGCILHRNINIVNELFTSTQSCDKLNYINNNFTISRIYTYRSLNNKYRRLLLPGKVLLFSNKVIYSVLRSKLNFYTLITQALVTNKKYNNNDVKHMQHDAYYSKHITRNKKTAR